MTTTSPKDRTLPPVPDNFLDLCREAGVHPFKRRRRVCGLSIVAMAKKCQTPKSAIQRYENGALLLPDRVPRIAEALGITPDDVEHWHYVGQQILDRRGNKGASTGH